MRIEYAKQFVKALRKSPQEIQYAFHRKLGLFIKDRFHPLLGNHPLHGQLKEYHSINVTGDWRALFREYDNGEVVFFLMIGTHSELYY